MKKEIFNQYVDEVAHAFEVQASDIFTKTKERTKVDARHVLYYLCKNRPMRITYIQKYMEDRGYKINHSSIIHGISQIEEKIAEDKDYLSLINKIEQCIV
tara:strand:+ start:1304 stop:1603 length:300 start_codon:yes stop_codon:yes gene_type:complete